MSGNTTTRIVWTALMLAGTVCCTCYPVLAYDTWTNNGEGGTNCASCHGDFRASSYTSKVDGQVWPTSLHNVHREDMLNRDCDTCHFSNQRVPTFTGKSNGGNGLGAWGCMGCHGRAQDGTGSGTLGWGAGLRQRHFRGGVNDCTACHADADPANKTVVGENVLPDYYLNPGTNHPNMPSDPCNPAPVYNENFAASTLGLDNDGDGLFDEADPDCSASSTPGETSGKGLDQLLATAVDPVAGVISLSYASACAASDNRIIYGPLTDVSFYGYSGQECFIGTSGTYDWFYPDNPAHLFYLVVADDGNTEGSYGTDGEGTERPPWNAAPDCPLPQDLSLRCD